MKKNWKKKLKPNHLVVLQDFLLCVEDDLFFYEKTPKSKKKKPKKNKKIKGTKTLRCELAHIWIAMLFLIVLYIALEIEISSYWLFSIKQRSSNPLSICTWFFEISSSRNWFLNLIFCLFRTGFLQATKAVKSSLK